jgi:DNA repair exonuclease SbcCD ATPase subunit
VIEELLDIGVFTKMNVVLKERAGLLKNEINETDNQLNILQETIKLQIDHINELEKIDSSQDEKRKKELTTLKEEVKVLSESNTSLQSKYDNKFDKVSNALKSSQELKNDTKIQKSSLKLQMDDVVKQARFYEKHDTCPTCAQALSADLKKQKNDECKTHAKNLHISYKSINGKLDKIDKEIADLQKSYTHLNEVDSSIRSNQTRITLIEKRITALSKTVATKQDTSKAKTKLLADQEKRNTLQTEKTEQSQLSSYYEAIGELLRDTGIKTKVIRQYLPVMNKLINQYLQVLDFFVLFNLDESFNETIRSRHRDDFSYASFSEGEKQRIDLSLLFAWRQIAKMKNSANTNLLILDETFDSSMDSDGVDNLMKILYTLKDDTNTFVISHKHAELEGKFPAKITFEKNGNFSQIKA